jgi:serine/threonine protein kinase
VTLDIKPENILLMESTDMPHIILSDFGMAKMIKETTDRKNTFCGTFHYLAPEVIYAGKSSSTMPSYLRNYDFSKCDPSITNGYGLKADLWSAGVVIYTMLTGKSSSKHINITY